MSANATLHCVDNVITLTVGTHVATTRVAGDDVDRATMVVARELLPKLTQDEVTGLYLLLRGMGMFPPEVPRG